MALESVNAVTRKTGGWLAASVLLLAMGCPASSPTRRDDDDGGSAFGTSRPAPLAAAHDIAPDAVVPAFDAAAACIARGAIGPLTAPEEACPILLGECREAGASCRCIRLRTTERSAGPFGRASVLEIDRGEGSHGYVLAVRAGEHWYVASTYPVVDGVEGGTENLAAQVLEDPRIESAPATEAARTGEARLSLGRRRCSWGRRADGTAAVCTAAERFAAITCGLAAGRPVCRDIAGDMESFAAGDAGCTPTAGP
ncbi:MAG: hypothetical protein ACRELB_12215 [Polyangiaceae bacterium]